MTATRMVSIVWKLAEKQIYVRMGAGHGLVKWHFPP